MSNESHLSEITIKCNLNTKLWILFCSFALKTHANDNNNFPHLKLPSCYHLFHLIIPTWNNHLFFSFLLRNNNNNNNEKKISQVFTRKFLHFKSQRIQMLHCKWNITISRFYAQYSTILMRMKKENNFFYN